MPLRRLAAVLATAVMLAGCASRPAPPPPAAPLAALPPAEQILASLAARRSAVHAVRALARLSYTSPEESRRAKQLVVAERPDRLRLEVLSPFGAVFVLATDGGTLAAYDRGESTVYRGTASAQALARYAGVDLPVDTAVDLLLGTPPLAPHPAAAAVVSEDDGAIKLWQPTDGDDAEAAWFSPGLEPLRYERHDGEGRVRLRTAFSGYTAIDGVRLPTVLAIELPADQRRIEIVLSETEVNPTLPDGVFALESPAGSREVDLDRVER